MKVKKKVVIGDANVNARMKIDYSKGLKPKVTFSYPSKRFQYHGNMFLSVFVVWMIINFAFLIIFSFSGFKETLMENFFRSGDVSLRLNYCYNYFNANYNHLLNKTCADYALNNTLKLYAYDILKITPFHNGSGSRTSIFAAIIAVVYIFGVPILITLLFKKRLRYFYPIYQSLGRKKYIKFFPKDVVKSEKGIYVEIPLFSNIILDYKTTKEFSKYLRLVEIKEHKFKYYYKRRRKESKIRRRTRRKQEINEWMWYSRFYFKKKPRNGHMEVYFR